MAACQVLSIKQDIDMHLQPAETIRGILLPDTPFLHEYILKIMLALVLPAKRGDLMSFQLDCKVLFNCERIDGVSLSEWAERNNMGSSLSLSL